MPVQVTTQGSLSSTMKTFYDRVLLERALPELIHAQFAQQKPIPPNNGKIIEFRKFASLPVALTPITEGVTPAGNSLTMTATTATVAEQGDYIEGSALLDLVSFDPVLTETAQLLGEQAGYSIDTLIRDVMVAGTSVQYANNRASRITVAAGDNLTITEIRKAVRTLRKNKARPLQGGDYVAFVGPSAVYDLQSDAAWVNAQQYAGSENIFAGEIGRLYGVRFIQTTETKVFAAGGAAGIDVHATMVLGQNFYAITSIGSKSTEFIFKGVGSSGTADPLNQRWTSGWKVMFGTKILNDSNAVRIEHSVSG